MDDPDSISPDAAPLDDWWCTREGDPLHGSYVDEWTDQERGEYTALAHTRRPASTSAATDPYAYLLRWFIYNVVDDGIPPGSSGVTTCT